MLCVREFNIYTKGSHWLRKCFLGNVTFVKINNQVSTTYLSLYLEYLRDFFSSLTLLWVPCCIKKPGSFSSSPTYTGWPAFPPIWDESGLLSQYFLYAVIINPSVVFLRKPCDVFPPEYSTGKSLLISRTSGIVHRILDATEDHAGRPVAPSPPETFFSWLSCLCASRSDLFLLEAAEDSNTASFFVKIWLQQRIQTSKGRC